MTRPLELFTWFGALVAGLVLVLALRDTPRPRVLSAFAPSTPTAAAASVGARVCVDVVRAPSKAALAGAMVRAFHEQPARLFQALGEQVTGADGRACLKSIPHGSLWLLAEAPGLARASTVIVVEGARSAKLELGSAAKLSVSVSDELGAPLARASVLVSASDPLPYGALCDAEGAARFERLPKAPWSVRVAAPGYESTTQHSVTTDLRVTLRRLAALNVSVLDEAGKAAPRAQVLIAGPTLWPARRAETDDRGVARVRGLSAGRFDLRAVHEHSVSATLFGVELLRGAEQSVTLRLAPGRMISARVNDGSAENNPVDAADVVLVEDGVSSFPYRGRSGQDGRVVLGPVAAGPASLAARASGFVAGPLIAVPENLSGAIDVPLVRGGTLAGEVLDARGYPIDGASIEVVGTDRYGLPVAETPLAESFRASHFQWSLAGAPALIPAGELGVMPGPVPGIPPPFSGAFPGLAQASAPATLQTLGSPGWVTRSNGEFEATPVTPGRVRALVRHPEYVEGASDLVPLAPGATARVRVVLMRGGSVEGRVVDERGFPVAAASVNIGAERGTFEHRSTTASDGTFAFAAVPAEVTLWVSSSEDTRGALRRPLEVPEGARVRVELVLPAARPAVNITVVDEAGQVLELAEVRARSLDPESPLRATHFTDAVGSVLLKDAAGLPLRLTVDAPGFSPLDRSFERAPEVLRLALDAGIGLVGRVTAVRGRFPAENALVTLRAGNLRKSTLTNRDGEFRFSGVPAGPAELRAVHPEHAEATLKVQVARTTRRDRPFELPPIDLAEAGEVEGEVLDASGRAVALARVALGVAPAYLPSGALPAGTTLSDANGRFSLKGLPPGQLRIAATAANVGRGSVDAVTVDAGRTTRGVVIRLTEPNEPESSLASGGVAATLGERGSSAKLEVVVVQVATGSEADRGGLLAGDVVSRIDGQRPASMRDARTRLSGRAGSDALLEVTRSGARIRLQIQREPVQR